MSLDSNSTSSPSAAGTGGGATPPQGFDDAADLESVASSSATGLGGAAPSALPVPGPTPLSSTIAPSSVIDDDSPTAATPDPAAVLPTPPPSSTTTSAEDPRALITYRDDFRLWPHVEKHLVPRLPLRNLTWRSLRGVRTIPLLDVRVRPFDPTSLPRTAMFAALTPTLHLYFVHCDDPETYRQVIRNEIKKWVALFNNKKDQEWLIVYIAAASDSSSTSSSNGTAKNKFFNNMNMNMSMSMGKTSVLDKIKADFHKSGDKRDRVVSLRLLDTESSGDHGVWGDFFLRVKDGLLASFESQVHRYDEDIARLDAQRLTPGWNFCHFFLLKEGLANCFEAIALHEDALIQYEELEAAHFQTLHTQITSFTTFGGTAPGDDHVAPYLFGQASRKDYRALLMSNDISVFDFRWYLVRQQLRMVHRQRHAAELATRAAAFLRQFGPVLAANEPDLPLFFAESFTLSFVDAVLAAVDAMIPALRLDPDAMARLQSTRLDLILLAKAALDRIGVLAHGARPSLGAPLADSGNAGSVRPEDLADAAAALANPAARDALASLAGYARVYSSYLDAGHMAASLAQKPRLATLLQTDRANLHFALGEWHAASALYAAVVATYAEVGWLLIDRSLLQRQAACYARLGATQEYLMTCLRLVASNIIHGNHHVPKSVKGDGLVHDADMAQLAAQAHELVDPVVVEFAPLFECLLPATLFTAYDAEAEGGVVTLPTAVRIVSHLAAPLAIDRISLSLVGGETNDLVFYRGRRTAALDPASDDTFELLPGENLVPMQWEKPSTAGDYVAEKVKIEVGRLVFVTNLLKENRKHTLRIHEPPNPVALALTLPPVLGVDNRKVMLRIDSALPVSDATVTLWSLVPQPTALQPVSACVLDPHDGDPTPLEPLPPAVGRFLVPAFTGAAELVLELPDRFDEASIKAVFEFEAAGRVHTVSLVDTVRNSAVPRIDRDVQVLGDDMVLVFEVTNEDPANVLRIDDYAVEVEGGSVVLTDLHHEATYLPPGSSTTLAFLVTPTGPSVASFDAQLVLHHHFLREDVQHHVSSALLAAMRARDLALYFPILNHAWTAHVASLDWTSLVLAGTMRVPDPGTLPLGILPADVGAALRDVEKEFYAVSGATVSLPDLVPAGRSRRTVCGFHQPMPAAHVQYALVPRDSGEAVVIGRPMPCELSIARSRGASELDAVYELDVNEDHWLVVGGRRRAFTIAQDASLTFALALIPLASGRLALPTVSIVVRSANADTLVTVEELAGNGPAAVPVHPEATATLVVVAGNQVQRIGQAVAAPAVVDEQQPTVASSRTSLVAASAAMVVVVE
ncbi:hypothetical protein H9P43_000261 [Blastocladiella emersonii ATCC 22665]|nr:hypothetical protein H9P43_000261 [Blastocladiella emersonii ATCC 22665]